MATHVLRFVNPFWQPNDSDASQFSKRMVGHFRRQLLPAAANIFAGLIRQRISWFVFSGFPLLCCVVVFFLKAIRFEHKKVLAPVMLLLDRNKKGGDKAWYQRYVEATFRGEMKAAATHVPFSLRIATCVVVSSLLMLFCAIAMFFFLDEVIPKILSVSCQLLSPSFCADHAVTHWGLSGQLMQSPTCYYDCMCCSTCLSFGVHRFMVAFLLTDIGEGQNRGSSIEEVWKILSESGQIGGYHLFRLCKTAQLVTTIIKYVAFTCLGLATIIALLVSFFSAVYHQGSIMAHIPYVHLATAICNALLSSRYCGCLSGTLYKRNTAGSYYEHV